MIKSSVTSALLPIMTVVFIGFLIIGMALPVLPLHVHQRLGLSTFVVGLVTGSQFVASLISRVWSGRYADSRGAKRAVIAGLVAAIGGGLVYLVSLRLVGAPGISAASFLLLGRALLGAAESFIITGGVAWGLALAGPANAGKVIAWIGMAMFAALAFGAPLGTTLYSFGGFASYRRRHGTHPASYTIAGGTPRPDGPATPWSPLDPSPQGGPRRLDAGIRLRTQQPRLRDHDRVQLLALRRNAAGAQSGFSSAPSPFHGDRGAPVSWPSA